MALLLPRSLIYFVLIRARDEVTADQWPSDSLNKEVSIDSAIGRWHALGRDN